MNAEQYSVIIENLSHLEHTEQLIICDKNLNKLEVFDIRLKGNSLVIQLDDVLYDSADMLKAFRDGVISRENFLTEIEE